MADNINETLENLTSAITLATQAAQDCCSSKGQVVESQPSDGTISVGEGQQFPDSSTYLGAKCSAANAIYDTVLGQVEWFRDNNVDLKAGSLGGITTAIVLGLALSGPVGWAIEKVAASIVTIAGWVMRELLDFDDLEDGLADVHEELVLALFGASNAKEAREDFLTALDTASPSPTPSERILVSLLLNNDAVNELFLPHEASLSYVSDDPIICGLPFDNLVLIVNSNTPDGAGEFLTSSKFEVSDVVVVSAVQENDCAGRWLVGVQLFDDVGARIEATVTTTTDVFLDYSGSGCGTNNFSELKDSTLAIQRAFADDTTQPNFNSVAGVHHFALRSGAPFTATITRNA